MSVTAQAAPRPHVCEPLACQPGALPHEGNVKLRNYRLIRDNLRAYTPTGDIHTSPIKNKLVSRFEVCSTISPPRDRILELLKPGDPGRDTLEDIVKPAPRRGLVRPLDEDTQRFLQRALLSPSPQGTSASSSPEPTTEYLNDTPVTAERSLAEELRDAEDEVKAKESKEQNEEVEVERENSDALERERLGRLALSVEDDETEAVEEGLAGASRRLDAMLVESRALHAELASIHADMQTQWARAGRCGAAAGVLAERARQVHFLDDVLSLLRGDVAGARMTAAWPFAVRPRDPRRNYVI